MSKILFIFRMVWRIYFLIYFCVTLILLYPFFLFLYRKNEATYTGAFHLMRFWAKILFFVPGIRPRLTYEAKLDRGRVYVFCPNHASYLDIIASYIAIPQYFVYMGKMELGKVPLFNIFFKKMNILVDRQSTTGSHKAYLQALQRIDRGESVIAYPEGTIPKNAPNLNPFKNGPFRIAVEKQVPVVPITFLDNWKRVAHDEKVKKHGGPGIARIVIHQPIETKGMTADNIPELKEKVFGIIHKALVDGKIL